MHGEAHQNPAYPHCMTSGPPTNQINLLKIANIDIYQNFIILIYMLLASKWLQKITADILDSLTEKLTIAWHWVILSLQWVASKPLMKKKKKENTYGA